jgi:hypothetical protein
MTWASGSLVPRTDRCRTSTGSKSAAHWAFFDPEKDGGQLDSQYPADGRDAAALAVHVQGLLFDLLRVVMTVALRGETVMAITTAVGMLALGGAVLGQAVGAAQVMMIGAGTGIALRPWIAVGLILLYIPNQRQEYPRSPLLAVANTP